jgi:hypothetical protein
MNVLSIHGVGRVEPSWLQDDASRTVSVIRTYLPYFEPKIESDVQHGWWTFSLPSPHGAEYRFSLHGELGGERQMSARLTQSREVSTRYRFWYCAMERTGRDDASKLETKFHERLTGLLKYPTRIIENKGVILLSYSAEYQNDAGWQSLGGVGYLGLGFEIPLVGKKRIYTSPPVASCTQQ